MAVQSRRAPVRSLQASGQAMKITRSGSLNTSSSVRRAGPARGTGGAFASHLSEPAASGDAPGVGGARPAASIDALLSVQEMGDALEQQAKARQRADDILDRLDDLRHGLLMGSLDKHQIEKLARLVRLKREAVTDPRLAEILDQIELRAEVELAKYSILD